MLRHGVSIYNLKEFTMTKKEYEAALEAADTVDAKIAIICDHMFEEFEEDEDDFIRHVFASLE